MAVNLPQYIPCLLLITTALAQAPMPGLRIEPVDGGSVLFVRNQGTQPLVAFHAELEGYPGSHFSHWFDDPIHPIGAGEERRIPVSSMLAAVASDYVHSVAVLYADGSAGGTQEEVEQLRAARRAMLDAAGEMIARLEKARAGSSPKTVVADGLKEWGAALTHTGARTLVASVAANLQTVSIEETLAALRAMRKSWAGK